jgi:dTDP-glucose 4,6-dehydratase
MRSLQSTLITGGAGFIGSTFVRRLLKENSVEKLVVLDKLTYAGARENLLGPDSDPRFHFVEGDVANTSLLKELFEDFRFTSVFHLAAESHVDRSIADSRQFAYSNVVGTAALLEQCRYSRCPLLHCSTDEVYGPMTTPEKATEDHPLKPTSPYAASKTSADLLCQAAVRTHEQDVIITRCTNNYGPRQHPEKLIPLLVRKALRDEKMPIYGNGMQTRDWIHVEDHCDGMLAAWQRGRKGQVYHFAGHCERTNVGIARSVLDCLRKPHSLIEHVKDRPGHDIRYALDTEKALMWFGWQPERSFRNSFPDVIRALASESGLQQ